MSIIILPVSVGEALDKLSILQIKKEFISDAKKSHVTQEITYLLPSLQIHIDKNLKYYHWLKWINQIIWDLNDNIRLLTLADTNYGQIMSDILNANEARFRIKTMIDVRTDSIIKVHKSYDIKKCTVYMPYNASLAAPLFGVIQWLTTQYDTINIVTSALIIGMYRDWFDEYSNINYDVIDSFNEVVTSGRNLSPVEIAKLICNINDKTITGINNEFVTNVTKKGINSGSIYDWRELTEISPHFITYLNVPSQIFTQSLFWARKNRLESADKNVINYVVGGCLGDCIHSLYIVMLNYLKIGKKGIVYITDNDKYNGDKFTTSLEQTYKELYPILIRQTYIHKFEILPDEPLQCKYINLNAWRTSSYLFSTEWNKMLTLTYGLENLPISWIQYPRESFANHIVIHRSIKTNRHVTGFPYLDIVKNNNCLFITCNIEEYNQFPYKEQVKLLFCEDLEKLASVISSCNFFIGNQSSPLALACSMRKPCLAELAYPIFYAGNEFSHDFFWIARNGLDVLYNLSGISKFINID